MAVTAYRWWLFFLMFVFAVAEGQWKNAPAEIESLVENMRLQDGSGTEGAMVLPSLKLVMCSYPKVPM